METNKCRMCQHFMQYYALGNGKLFRVHCGHCVLGKAKRKQPDAQACPLFLQGKTEEDAFVNKDYLSKKLLKYILDMELLPEIWGKGP